MDYKDYNDYELVYMIKEDNEEAVNIMIRKYEPLIRKMAFSFCENYSGMDMEDLVQEGRIALCFAMNNYSNIYGVLFYTYALRIIKNTMLNCCNKSSRIKRKSNNSCCSIDDLYDVGYEVSYDNIVCDMDFYKDLVKFKNSLSFEDSIVFELRYNGFSYSEIANFLDVSVKKIDNKIFSIKKKLKKYIDFGY